MGRPLALIVNRNRRYRASLGRSLRSIHFRSRYVSNLTEARKFIDEERHQLVVLRLNGQRQEVYAFCYQVCRYDPFLTVVVILPEIDLETESKLFDCGVADVVTVGQAEPAVLLKRIIARLNPRLVQLSHKHWIRLGSTWVNLSRCEVWRNGRLRWMSDKTAALLQHILAHPQRVISRKELYHCLAWKRNIAPPEKGGKAVDMLVSNLRKLIEPDPQNPQIILSIKFRGYVLAPDLRGNLRTAVARELPKRNSRPRVRLGQELVAAK